MSTFLAAFGASAGGRGADLAIVASFSPASTAFSASFRLSFMASEKVAACTPSDQTKNKPSNNIAVRTSCFNVPAILPRSLPRPARFFGPKMMAAIAPITASSPQPRPNRLIFTLLMPFPCLADGSRRRASERKRLLVPETH